MSATPLTCPDCGRQYACTPGQGCWCEAMPAVLPVPKQGKACLCPCRLEALARDRLASGQVAPDQVAASPTTASPRR